MPRKRIGTLEEQALRDRYTKLRSMLRRAWSRDPERYAVLNAGKREYKGANKRQKVEYQCASCLQWFKATEIHVDHLHDAGTFLCEADWATFGPRLFCSKEYLQILCISGCHRKKTNEERKNGKSKQEKKK